MPEPRYRSRSLRRRYLRTPGGRVTIHYWRKKPDVAKCALCGQPLRGVPRLRPAEFRKLTKSQRRPERPFGGCLCHKCLALEIKKAVRGIA